MDLKRRPTRRVPEPPPRGAPRSARFAPPAKKSNKGLIIGGSIGGGVLLLIIIIAAASSGGGKKPEARKAAPRARAVNYDEMEREGLRKCDEGLRCVQSSEAFRNDPSSMRAELEKGKNLITEGIALLDQVNQKTQRMFDTQRYGQALKLARTKLMEMPK